MGYVIHESAYVSLDAVIGDGTKIWHHAVVQAGARIGRDCTLGQNVHVADGAIIGNGVKIQNNVSVYCGVELEDFVFCGPSMVFTNVLFPRSEFPKPKSEYQSTLIKRGATLGAACTILAGVTVGCYALVGSGAVVTTDVPSHALMTGVPARRAGWACICGHLLSNLTCPTCGRRYQTCEEGLCPIPEEGT